MGHGFFFVLAQEFKNRMHCLMVFTNEVETTFALEQGLLSVLWNQPRAVGKTDVFYFKRFDSALRVES